MGKYTKPAKRKNKNNKLTFGVIAILILLVSAGFVITTRLSNPEPVISVQSVGGQFVNVQEAYQLVEEGVFVLDVRTDAEWDKSHISDAILIPLDQLPGRMQELPDDQPILVYCRSGNRSGQALSYLVQAGFTNVSSMEGGINNWIGAGYKVVTGP